MAEIRKDIITGGYVIISPERGKRPHDFKVQKDQKSTGECPFCPGNESKTPPELLAYRDDGSCANEKGWSIRAVPNLFSPLQKDVPNEILENEFYQKTSSAGSAEVFIETPDHDSTLGTHPHEQVVKIINGLVDRYMDLKTDQRLKYIQVFKNFGAVGGASKEHAHWQIMAVPLIPSVIETELAGSKRYFEDNKSCAFCDIIGKELEEKMRVAKESDNFVAICPYASRYAFETWILPKQHSSEFEKITGEEIDELATVLQGIIKKLEQDFNFAPYNIVLHTSPIGIEEEPYYHWHLEILPRLTVFAGFELGSGMIINPTPPELAAQSFMEPGNQ